MPYARTLTQHRAQSSARGTDKVQVPHRINKNARQRMTTVGISSSRARIGFGLFRDSVLADLEVILSSITRRSIMNHNNNAKRNTKSSDASHDVPRRIESRRLLPEGLPNQIRSNVGGSQVGRQP